MKLNSFYYYSFAFLAVSIISISSSSIMASTDTRILDSTEIDLEVGMNRLQIQQHGVGRNFGKFKTRREKNRKYRRICRCKFENEKEKKDCNKCANSCLEGTLACGEIVYSIFGLVHLGQEKKDLEGCHLAANGAVQSSYVFLMLVGCVNIFRVILEICERPRVSECQTNCLCACLGVTSVFTMLSGTASLADYGKENECNNLQEAQYGILLLFVGLAHFVMGLRQCFCLAE